MHHEVPFHSQYEGITDPAWKWRGCGIVALKMVLDYWHIEKPENKTVPISELLKVGREMNAYREEIGWIHSGLVRMAQRYGYEALNTDFAANGPSPKSALEAWDALLNELQHGPVLASVYAGLDSERGGGHIIIVTGFENDLVAFNDPEGTNAGDGKRFIVLSRFLSAFKRRAIIIRPGASRDSQP